MHGCHGTGLFLMPLTSSRPSCRCFSQLTYSGPELQALARERLAQMREEMAVREATEKELRRAIKFAGACYTFMNYMVGSGPSTTVQNKT